MRRDGQRCALDAVRCLLRDVYVHEVSWYVKQGMSVSVSTLKFPEWRVNLWHL